MSTIRPLSAAAFAVLLVLSAAGHAQQSPEAQASAAAKPMSRHDHAATKGLPTARPAANGAAEAASAPQAAASKAKKQVNHDHTRSHKLM